MSTVLIIAAWLAPLLLLPLAFRDAGKWWPALAVLPAVAAALVLPVGSALNMPWLLLGVTLELDPTGQRFMLFSALLWLFAALYAGTGADAAAHSTRFRIFFLLSLAGNMLLILAADMMTFYCGFALMGLAAYGMIVQRRTQQARRAGRVYLGWTLTGELALFSAIALLSADLGSTIFADLQDQPFPAAAAALLVLGFGIKMALPGLHFWLPMTYAAAPITAAAVLSGPMISAGLLGWLRFLPAGTEGLSDWAVPLQSIGITGIVLGTVLGWLQHDPRALLGCSSILKMGVITAVFGTALGQPEAAPAILAALMLYALHHSLVKGALFLGLGEWRRVGKKPWVLAGLGLLALTLIGAPLSGGAAAKFELKVATTDLSSPVALILLLSALATVLLLGRFFWLITQRRGTAAAGGIQPSSLIWLTLVPLALWLPFNPFSVPLYADGLIPLGIGLTIIVPWWVFRAGRTKSRRRPVSMTIVRRLNALRLHPRVQNMPAWFKAPALFLSWRLPAGGQQIVSLATGGLLWLSIFLLLLVLLING